MSSLLSLHDEPVAALAAHAERVAQLRRSRACGGHPDAAGLIETPLSSLLLAGGQVYKLKKPVALPFVDFSTLALRHAACNEELRLNRRTAPQWYLGVVPVQQTGSGAVIAGPGQTLAGTVIDWAVCMRRFDNRQAFDRLAAAGQLSEAQVDGLACAVVAFQAVQPPLPAGPGPADADAEADAETTCQAVRNNVAELAAMVVGTALAAPVAALQRWSRAAEQPALMAQRARDGRVRDGHGDLHLGNVFWADGAAVLFDALEFDARLRQIDTVGELAFTFMDLLAHGLPQLAWRFINTTLEASGDWGALPLLAWWAVHRAAVRAKVALLGVPAGADDAARAVGLARAQHYLEVAGALAGPRLPRLPLPSLPFQPAQLPQLPHLPYPPHPPHPPQRTQPPHLPHPSRPLQLVLMMGLSGSGKTATAGQLAQQLGGVRLRSDVERKRLFGLPATARGEPSLGLYTPEATRRTYAHLLVLAEAALQAGVAVVVDAASLHRVERDAFRALAGRLGVAFKLVLCEAPAAVLAQRLAARTAAGQDASDATVEVLRRQQQFTEWPAEDERADLLRLDTDVERAQLAASVMALALD